MTISRGPPRAAVVPVMRQPASVSFASRQLHAIIFVDPHPVQVTTHHARPLFSTHFRGDALDRDDRPLPLSIYSRFKISTPSNLFAIHSLDATPPSANFPRLRHPVLTHLQA